MRWNTQPADALFRPTAVAYLFPLDQDFTSYWMVKNYREDYNLFACNGILFNHASPRRGESFVTRKITIGIAGVMAGKKKNILFIFGTPPKKIFALKHQLIKLEKER